MFIAAVIAIKIAVDRNHIAIVAGNAIMYRIRLVKLQSRKKLPTKPVARDKLFSE